MKRNPYSLILLTILCIGLSACSVRSRPAKLFSDPADAIRELEDAVASRSVEKADALFGSEGDYILHTGDPVMDKKRGQKFVQLFTEAHSLEKKSEDSYLLLLGKREWPFPVPLVRGKDGWFFDAEAGKEVIISRTVGRNELSALEVARMVPVTQRIYAATDWDNDGVREYASRVISTPNNRDGLYWPTRDDEPASPLGPFIARAAEESYTIDESGEPRPFRGYYFRLFTSPPSANTDSDLLSKPGTYWLLAYPALWGSSGVMSFAVNERGWIYEKDLDGKVPFSEVGPVSVDGTWTRIE